MGVVSKFENAMEGAVEGSFARLFRSKLQPAEIQKRLERVMEEQREIALGKSFVPNRYEVFLNPQDYNQFAPYKTTLEQEMSNHVLRYGQERHFSFQNLPRVWLNQNAEVRRRQMSIKAYTVDPTQSIPVHYTPSQPDANPDVAANFNPDAENDALAGRTAIMNVGAQVLTGQHKAVNTVTRPEATLVILDKTINYASRYIRFNKDVGIGRGLDNDVVFDNDVRVSRHHARIEFKYGQFVLTDTNSTNGTTVNTRPVTQIVLSPGDRISLGGLNLLFQVD